MNRYVAANLAIEAISIAIGKILPESQVFDDRVPQSIVPGAFIVRLISQIIDPAIGLVDLNDGDVFSRRQCRRPTFEVRYYPVSDEGGRDSECRDVEELLVFALEQVTTLEGVVLAAEDVHSVITDGVLVMTLDYPYIIEDTRYADPMQHMEYNDTGAQLVND